MVITFYFLGTRVELHSPNSKGDPTMSYKIVSTALLVIIASSLLIILALKVKTETTSLIPGENRVASKGCCGNSGSGCATADRRNKAQGE